MSKAAGWSEPTDDVLGDGWVARTLSLPPDAEGTPVATLVHRADTGGRARAVLYVHGFTDYFFNAAHALQWDEEGYDFYAIDLRDHGRSIRPGRTPNLVADLRDYDTELDAALALMRRAGHTQVVLLGHSTGGLVGVLYAHDHPGAVDALVLNSPFFDLNASWFDRVVSTRLIDRVGARRPLLPVSGLGGAYGGSLHRSTGGEFDYDLAWKPLEGFTVHAGWLRAIRRGHARLARGLAVLAPVLVATSGRSGDRRRPSARELETTDVVLDVRHMWSRAPLIGPHVRVMRIPGGRHDLTLSTWRIRKRYRSLLFDWLERQLPDLEVADDPRVRRADADAPPAAEKDAALQ